MIEVDFTYLEHQKLRMGTDCVRNYKMGTDHAVHGHYRIGKNERGAGTEQSVPIL
jgi:hypothetical protein